MQAAGLSRAQPVCFVRNKPAKRTGWLSLEKPLPLRCPAMPPDPPLDRITAIMAALLGPVTGPPDLIGFDFADLRAGLIEGGLAVFGQGEASGPDRAIRAADAALADIRQRLRGGRGIPP